MQNFFFRTLIKIVSSFLSIRQVFISTLLQNDCGKLAANQRLAVIVAPNRAEGATMTWNYGRMLVAGALTLAPAPPPASANDLLFVTTGEFARPPIGWVEFCAEHPVDCKATASVPRDVVVSNKAWTDLARIKKR